LHHQGDRPLSFPETNQSIPNGKKGCTETSFFEFPKDLSLVFGTLSLPSSPPKTPGPLDTLASPLGQVDHLMIYGSSP